MEERVCADGLLVHRVLEYTFEGFWFSGTERQPHGARPVSRGASSRWTRMPVATRVPGNGRAAVLLSGDRGEVGDIC